MYVPSRDTVARHPCSCNGTIAVIESLCPIHSLLEYIRWGPISPEVIGDDIDNDSDHDDSDDDNNNNDDNDNDGAIKLYNLNE